MKNLQEMSLQEMRKTEGGINPFYLPAIIQGSVNLYNFYRGFASAFN